MDSGYKSKVQEAEEFGIDVTLLHRNLSHTPAERLEDLESMIEFVEELRQAKRIIKRAEAQGNPANTVKR